MMIEYICLNICNICYILKVLTYGGSIRTRWSSLNLLVQSSEGGRHGGGSGGSGPTGGATGRARENTYSFV